MRKLILSFLCLSLGIHSFHAQIKFVCMGNSISHGKYTATTLFRNTIIGDSLTEMTYRFFLWEKLDSAGLNVTNVGYNTKYFTQWGVVINQKSRYTGHAFVNAHEAYYGINTAGFIAGGWSNDGFTAPDFDTRLQGYTPDVALMELGYNDNSNTTPSVDVTEANLKTIIGKLRGKNPNITILISKQIFHKPIDDRLPRIAGELSTKNSIVYVVDQTTNFKLTYTVDGTHPNAMGGMHMANRWFAAYMKVSKADAVAPSAPAAPVVSGVKTTTADLSWTATTDNEGVNVYNIYANDVLVGSTGLLKFKIRGLSPNTSYVFKITALDYQKNESAKSTGTNATTGAAGTFGIDFNINDGTNPVQDVNVTFGTTTNKTDASGLATFTNVTTGNVAYTIAKMGWKTQTGTINLNADSAMTFKLMPNCSITVVVKSGSALLANAEVTFDGVPKTTDAQGKALFTGLRIGTKYSYSAKLSGYNSVGTNVTIYGDTTLNISMSGVDIPEVNNEILIYPVPANDQITITNAEGAQIEIINILGEPVITSTMKSSSEIIHIDALQKGYYFIRVVRDQNNIIRKIAVER